MSISVLPKCPNCGSLDVVGGEGYFFCNVCGWDELDGEESLQNSEPSFRLMKGSK